MIRKLNISFLLIFFFLANGINFAQSKVDSLFEAAETYFVIGEYQSAEKIYSKIIQIDSTHGNSYWKRARIFGAWEEYGKALNDLVKVNEIAPQFADGFLLRGWYLLLLQRLEEAEKYSLIALNMNRTNLTAILNLAHVYLFQNKFENAKELYFEFVDYSLSTEDFLESFDDDFQIFFSKNWIDKEKNQVYEEVKKYFAVIGKHKINANQCKEEAANFYLSADFGNAAQKYADSYKEEIKTECPRIDLLEIVLNGAGVCFYKIYDYKNSTVHFLELLVILKNNKHSKNLINTLNYLGLINKQIAKYDESVKYFLEAIDSSKSFSDAASMGVLQNNIAGLFLDIGKFDQAKFYFSKALKIEESLQNKKMVANINNNMGVLEDLLGNYDSAIEFYLKAFSIFEELNNNESLAVIYSNIGRIYQKQKEYNKARGYFDKSLSLVDENNLQSRMDILKNIGTLFQIELKFDSSLVYFNRSLEISRTIGSKHEFNILGDISLNYYMLKNYNKCYNYISQTIKAIENYRAVNSELKTREYLEQQLHYYSFLSEIYFKLNKPDSALYKLELAKAKILAEKINKRFNSSPPKNILDFDGNSAAIVFSRFDWDEKMSFFISENTLDIRLWRDSSFVKQMNKLLSNEEIENIANLRGARIKYFSQENLKKKNDNADFNLIIKYYHSLLANPNQANSAKVEKLARELYILLIKPYENLLKGKKEIIIIPDGITAIIPFESLIDENGKYLAEKFSIKYNFSLTVNSLLQKRIYSSRRKKILAFGGADYSAGDSKSRGDAIKNNRELEILKNQVMFAENENLQFAFEKLGYEEWSNLPGTMEEVIEIGNIISDAEIMTGRDVSESEIKKMSQAGELKKYKTIHFATHGIAVPEIPELSALVLSINKNDSLNDGYLTMNEIANLNLEADFVNLSACETGLGKIYNGEGVVGLTQSFLMAGANGLSVSLWQVADKSTSLFMSEMYKYQTSENVDFLTAISEIKKRFINGDYGKIYSYPFYWAPFIYYGK